MGTEAIGYVLGQHCAPVLAGIKPSNLLIVEKGNKNGIRHVLRGTRICGFLLYSSEEKDYWLLFDPYELEEMLAQPEKAAYLRSCGYETSGVGAVLRTLSARFCRYKETGGNFPHEMGILFGYPLGDVRGFIENKGKNFKRSGYWKVYDDVAYADQMFRMYADVRKRALELCDQGVCIRDIWKSFRNDRTEQPLAAARQLAAG